MSFKKELYEKLCREISFRTKTVPYENKATEMLFPFDVQESIKDVLMAEKFPGEDQWHRLDVDEPVMPVRGEKVIILLDNGDMRLCPQYWHLHQPDTFLYPDIENGDIVQHKAIAWQALPVV